MECAKHRLSVSRIEGIICFELRVRRCAFVREASDVCLKCCNFCLICDA